MPKNDLQKALHSYLLRIKREARTRTMQLSSRTSSSRKWVLSRYKHPKKLLYSTRRKHRTIDGGKDEDDGGSDEDTGGGDDDAATLSDVDRFLHENFKSLYIKEDDGVDVEGKVEKKIKPREDDASGGDEEDEKVTWRRWRAEKSDSKKPSDPTFGDYRPEKIFSPGSSSDARRSAPAETTTTTTIVDDKASSSNSSSRGFHRTEDEGCPTETETETTLPEKCIAMPKYTEEPYEEFRQSMLEMVEARLVVRDCTVDWDFMEELLLCYLNLNDKSSHKFILNAFVDVIATLRRTERRIARKHQVRSPRSGFRTEKTRRTRRIRHPQP